MPNWLTRLLGETQVRMLVLLRRSRRTITELASQLDLTDNAVRTHIAALDRQGMIEAAGTRREARGKPARVYTLSREGEELFPKAYALVLGRLVEEITRTEGADRARELLRSVGEGLAETGGLPRDPKARVKAAASLLRGLGGDVDVERNETGWRIQGHGCPLSSVTASHPEVCALAGAIVEEVTGQRVTECCDRTGRPRCAFQVSGEPTAA
jgi:predicted ArsR family transcriptional regulator